MSSVLFVILLQVAGVAAIIAEFIVPSAGLLSVIAAGAIGYSIVHLFTHVSTAAGVIAIGLDLILIPAAVVVGIKGLARSKLSLHTTLSRESGVSSQDLALEALVGKTGVAATDLRPSGKALIDNIRYDVVAESGFVTEATPVIVREVNGNRIVVREIDAMTVAPA